MGSNKPRVLQLSLDDPSAFEDVHERLLGMLKSTASLERALEPKSALQILAGQPPQVVLVADGGIADHTDVLAKLLEYARGGGVLIFMGAFSSFVTMDDLDRILKETGLSWTRGRYFRTTVHRNDTEQRLLHNLLPTHYSQKAIFLENVPAIDAWYLPDESSNTESYVFPNEPVQNLKQTPVAFTSIGNGKLGYVGDVNGEEGSDAVILAMCGLLSVA